ncbi:hypothetical protein MH928_17330 [Flavobacterium sp. WW92]|uniref:hypothetical protein n=1 Tax=Flavobacterium sp. WW92 TaxID=1454066 RepID=UPI002377FBC5|nr:hypothetical protein [Flavobacterium sp. WW92]WDO13071.1 hypothetical protein MH928_17330 [Flavobacterium sp. WW92]
MLDYKKESIYGIAVYSFTTDNNIYYQVTFEEDLDPRSGRFKVDLQNLNGGSELAVDHNVKHTVCECIKDYITEFPDREIYYEIDLTHKRNISKLKKFLHWATSHKNYSCKVEVTTGSSEDGEIIYAEVLIKKKKTTT